MSIFYKYIVIGAGPVGASFSLMIDNIYEGEILLLEKHSNIKNVPKAVHLDLVSLDILNSIGINKFRKYPLNEVIYDLGKSKIILNNEDIKKLIAYNGSCWFHQGELEYELWSSINKSQKIRFNKNETVLDVIYIKEDKHYKIITNKRTYLCEYLVAADGTNSIVKEKLNIYDDKITKFEQSWVVFDLIDENSNLPHTHIQYCDSNMPFTYIRYGENIRIETIKENISDILIFVTKYFKKNIDFTTFKIVKKSIYSFKASHISKMEENMCFFIGDSAHTMPPFAGKGLCSGLRDSISLASCLGSKNKDIKKYIFERKSENRNNIILSVLLGYLITYKLNKFLKRKIFQISIKISNFFNTNGNTLTSMIGIRRFGGVYLQNLLKDISIFEKKNFTNKFMIFINKDFVDDDWNEKNTVQNYDVYVVSFKESFRSFVINKNIHFFIVQPNYKICDWGKLQELVFKLEKFNT